MPALNTMRLQLVMPLLHEQINLERHLKWLNNEEINRYSEQRHVIHSQKTQYEFIKLFDQKINHFWEIQCCGNPIGSISAYRDIYNFTANVGIMIGEQRCWGNGYGPEAWEAVCKFLFGDGVRKIEAGCMAANHAMIRILQKNEFKHEAVIPGHFLLNGKPEDKWCYGKNRQAEIIQLKKD